MSRDHGGLGEGEEVTVVEQVLGGVAEARAADVGLGHAVGADGGAHGAVDDGDAGFEDFFQRMGVGCGHGLVGSGLAGRVSCASIRIRCCWAGYDPQEGTRAHVLPIRKASRGVVRELRGGSRWNSLQNKNRIPSPSASSGCGMA